MTGFDIAVKLMLDADELIEYAQSDMECIEKRYNELAWKREELYIRRMKLLIDGLPVDDVDYESSLLERDIADCNHDLEEVEERLQEYMVLRIALKNLAKDILRKETPRKTKGNRK